MWRLFDEVTVIDRTTHIFGSDSRTDTLSAKLLRSSIDLEFMHAFKGSPLMTCVSSLIALVPEGGEKRK